MTPWLLLLTPRIKTYIGNPSRSSRHFSFIFPWREHWAAWPWSEHQYLHGVVPTAQHSTAHQDGSFGRREGGGTDGRLAVREAPANALPAGEQQQGAGHLRAVGARGEGCTAYYWPVLLSFEIICDQLLLGYALFYSHSKAVLHLPLSAI